MHASLPNQDDQAQSAASKWPSHPCNWKRCRERCGPPAGRDWKLHAAEHCLLFLAALFCALSLVGVVEVLQVTPYGQVFYFWCGCFAAFCVFSVGLLVVLAFERDEKGSMRHRVNWSCVKITMQTWQGVLFGLCFFGGIASLVIMCSFMYPESFWPTKSLSLRRIGGVTDSSAAFFLRQPFNSPQSVNVLVRKANSTVWQFNASAPRSLEDNNDWTAWIKVNGLQSNTSYEWRFDLQGETIRLFKTLPAPGTPAKFSFAWTSCSLFNFPWHSQTNAWNTMASLEPDYLVFLGDLIYADVPIFRGTDAERFWQLYRGTLNNPGLQAVLQSTPNYFMFDDHEMENNADFSSTFERGAFPNAIETAWFDYAGGGNPVNFPQSCNETCTNGLGETFYFSFDVGDSSFFVLDTRSQRSPDSMEDSPDATLLGTAQRNRLLSWLVEKNSTSRFKFIFSPDEVTDLMAGGNDLWGGRMFEREAILSFVRDERIAGVAWFSGDSHLQYIAELDPLAGSGMYEFSSSPLSAFDWSLDGGIILGGGYSLPLSPFVGSGNDSIVWSNQGRIGLNELMGRVLVDTTVEPPTLSIEFWDFDHRVFIFNLTLSEMTPWVSV